MAFTLPSDVLDEVVNHVEDYSDVLNVALSSKDLFSIAVPHHLHFRDIRTRLQNPALWSWLSRLDDLRAAHVRSLTILPDNGYDFYTMSPADTYDFRERLPSDFIPSESLPFTSHRNLEACLESEMSLVTVLKRMSNLKRFRWYRVPRPLLQEGPDDVWSTLRRLGTVRELDIFDDDVSEIEVSSIANSETFLHFDSLTSLKLRTTVGSQSYDPEIPQLEQMVLHNCPNLEVLVLELDLDEHINGTANIDHLLDTARWPNLRVLRLRGMNCRAPALTRFLAAHPSLKELALAQIMPGHAWTRLALPSDALPNLRHLECSSSQAAALMKSSEVSASARPLETLIGIELRETVVDSKFFSWDDEWEEDEDHDDAEEERPSPWKLLLLEGLITHRTITRLGAVSVSSKEEIKTLAVVAPQVKDIELCTDYDFVLDPESHSLYSLFPDLEVIRGGDIVWFDPLTDVLTSEEAEKANVQIQRLARLCPKLRVLLVSFRAKKAVIIRDGGLDMDVRWVVRKYEESESPDINSGERVYGP
ncbi:hypothetical protein B0H34DRAFT_808883 [Crassisporium funariophilum]|nr:hypothetical protein B0H34DRAFT_808883 [Crassisporium funariophilum]